MEEVMKLEGEKNKWKRVIGEKILVTKGSRNGNLEEKIMKVRIRRKEKKKKANGRTRTNKKGKFINNQWKWKKKKKITLTRKGREIRKQKINKNE